MKFLLFICVAPFFVITGYAQPDSSMKVYTLIQTFSEASLSVYVGRYYERRDGKLEKLAGFYDILLIRTGSEIKDTVIVDKCDCIYPDLDTVYSRLIELDKSGQRGILITRIINETSNLGEHGTYSISKTINEIWDIKAGKKIFSAISKYGYQGDYMNWDDSSSYSSTTSYSFEYDLVVSGNEIVIKNLKTNLDVSEDRTTINESGYPHYCECLIPEHQEGAYLYSRAGYVLIEKE